jgi:hypothetical protein
MLLVWATAIAGYGLGRYFWKRSRQDQIKPTTVPIAHSSRLTQLPEYQLALKRYRQLLYGVTTALSLAVLLGVLLTARPASLSLITPAQKNRDIMLCLDVSGSLLRTDTKIVNRFNLLVKNFSGQRIGLTVFNSSSTVVLPLSDDYELISSQLNKVGKALQVQKGQDFTDLTSGTLADFDKGTSLVTDGLVSCVNNLGQNKQERSQSIILATDNEANGTPIITTEQATAYVQKRNIHVYALDPGQADTSRASEHEALKTMAEKTGGNYYRLNDNTAINSIVNAIADQEAKYEAGVQVVAVADRPAAVVYIAAFAAVTAFVLLWRLRI